MVFCYHNFAVVVIQKVSTLDFNRQKRGNLRMKKVGSFTNLIGTSL